MKKPNKAPAVVIDFNVAQLLKNPTGAARDLAIDADIRGLDPSLDPAGNVQARVKVVRTKSGALVTLTGAASLWVPCSRCLEPVAVPVALQFEEEFLQTVDVITGLSLGASHDDPALLIDDHHDIHLADIIREYLLIEQPMYALCREDCRGLCPQCGRNLNLGPCGCSSVAGDERWSALQALLKD